MSNEQTTPAPTPDKPLRKTRTKKTPEDRMRKDLLVATNKLETATKKRDKTQEAFRAAEESLGEAQNEVAAYELALERLINTGGGATPGTPMGLPPQAPPRPPSEHYGSRVLS